MSLFDLDRDLEVGAHDDEPLVGTYLDLANLLSCVTRAQLRQAWLDLTDDQRRALRPNRALAHHAWSLIIRDRILTTAGGTR